MKSFIEFVKEAAARAKQETPQFWIQIRRFWAWVTAVSTIVVGMDAADLNVLTAVMPDAIAHHIADICKYAAAIGVISALQTKLTVKTPPSPPDSNIETK